MSEVKLRNCPCCGGKAFVNARRYWDEKAKDFTVYTYGVTCYDCQTGTWQYYRKEDDAIESWNTRKPMDDILERLEEELKLADEEKERCSRGNHLMFDSAKSYATGISNAIEILKGGVEDGKID